MAVIGAAREQSLAALSFACYIAYAEPPSRPSGRERREPGMTQDSSDAIHLDPDTPPKPIEVRVSPAVDQTGAISRDILLIASVLPALIAVIGKRDLQAIINYISSTEFAPVLSIIVATVVIGWRQWITRRNHAEALKMARNVDDKIAFVTGEK